MIVVIIENSVNDLKKLSEVAPGVSESATRPNRMNIAQHTPKQI